VRELLPGLLSADQPFLETDADPDPYAQFAAWYQDAERGGVLRADAMALATATPDGLPSVRMVLLKGLDHHGLVFFSNRESRKARELEVNVRASAVFYWRELHRQVRLEGSVEPLSHEESERYFATRPRGAQLAASASSQSRLLSSRDELERRYDEVSREFEGREVPLPRFWGGFRLAPSIFEFWQGGENRLHDRLRYTLGREGWQIERLWP
jgi:pyridoxamine 5'-phosphate oxidase